MKVDERLEELGEDVFDSESSIPEKDAFYRAARKLLDENPDIEYDFITSDIEHFRVINDRYGYELGDELLRYSAKMVQQACRMANGICGRYFADIFMSIIPRKRRPL